MVTTGTHGTRRLSVLAAALLAVLLTLITAMGTASAATETVAGRGPATPPPRSAPTADPAPDAGGTDVDPGAAKALARQRGLSVAGATTRLRRERDEGALGERIE